MENINLKICRLKKRQKELLRLHKNFEKVDTKFVQPSEMKLRSEKHRGEIRLDRWTIEYQEIQRFAEECLRDVTEMRIKLKETENERDLWKSTAMRERIKVHKTRSEVKDAEESIEKKKENISRNMRYEEMEKSHNELSACYDKAKEEVHRLDEKIKKNTKEKESFERKTRELANLLETLEHFDLDVKTLCRLTAEAVANLTKVELHFVEAIKKLRQFTWKANERECDKETDKLRSQNLVLREIVKSLKRKIQFRSESHVERENDLTKSIEQQIENSYDCNDLKANTNIKQNLNEPRIEHEASSQKENHIENLANDLEKKQTLINDWVECKKCSSTRCNRENKDQNVSKTVDEKVLCIESHKNGIFYYEYVIRFSNTRQMKIKHSPVTSIKMAHLKLEIFDCEEKYQECSPDKVVILLKNLSTSIKIERTGINCATQTKLTRKCDNYTQTSITQIRDFLRLNVGHAMLNSEKRAIERNLSNLERTVAHLKCNALHHAKSMIGNKSKCLKKEEFFQCIERLHGGEIKHSTRC